MSRKRTDTSTDVVKAATDVARRIRAVLSKEFFVGPMRERLTRGEAIRRLQDMPPEERIRMAEEMGVDNFLREAEKLQYASQ